MSRTKKISNLNIVIDSSLVSGYVVAGFGETDMISTEAENDRVTQKTDAKGDVFNIINEKNNGTMTITVNELSDAVSVLDDHISQNEKMEILRDMSNGDKLKYTDVFIVKDPSKSTTSEDDEYEYECVYGNVSKV